MTTTNTITTANTPAAVQAADVICSTSVLWHRIPGPARITTTSTAAAAYKLQPAEGRWDVGGQIDCLDIPPASPAVHAVPVQPVQASTVIWYDADDAIRIVTAAGSYLVAQAGAAAIITPLRPAQNNPATDAGKILRQQIPPITAVYSHGGSVLSALQIIDPSIGRVPPRRTAVTAGGYKILRRLKQDAAKDAAEYAAARAAWTVYDRQTYSPSLHQQPRTWSELVECGLVPRPDDDDQDDNHVTAVPPSVWTGAESASWVWEVHVTSPAAAAGTYYVRSAARDIKGKHYTAGQAAHAYIDQAWTGTKLKYYIVPFVQPGDLRHNGLRLHQAASQAVNDYVRFLRRNDAAGHLTISLDDQADLITIAECRIVELLSGPLPDKYPIMTGRRHQMLIRSLSELCRYEARKAVNAWRTRQYRTNRAVPLLEPDRNPMIDPPRVAPSAPPRAVSKADSPVYPDLDARLRDVITEVWPRLPAGARQIYDAVYWHHIPITAVSAAAHITPQTGYHRLHRAEQRILAAVRKDAEAMRLLRMYHPLITVDEVDAAILAAARKAR